MLGVHPIDAPNSLVYGNSVWPGDGIAVEEYFNILPVEFTSNNGRIVARPIGDKKMATDGVEGNTAWFIYVRLADYTSAHSTFAVGVYIDQFNLQERNGINR